TRTNAATVADFILTPHDRGRDSAHTRASVICERSAGETLQFSGQRGKVAHGSQRLRYVSWLRVSGSSGSKGRTIRAKGRGQRTEGTEKFKVRGSTKHVHLLLLPFNFPLPFALCPLPCSM